MNPAALAVAVAGFTLVSALILIDVQGEESPPEPAGEHYVRTPIEYDMEYKNTLHGEVYLITFDAPADGYAVIRHGSERWFEEHRMFHEGRNSIAVERQSSVGRPSVEFFTEADRDAPLEEMPRLRLPGRQDRLRRSRLRLHRVPDLREAHRGASRGRIEGRMEQEGTPGCPNTIRPNSSRSCRRTTWRSRASQRGWRTSSTPTSTAWSIQTSPAPSTPSWATWTRSSRDTSGGSLRTAIATS